MLAVPHCSLSDEPDVGKFPQHVDNDDDDDEDNSEHGNKEGSDHHEGQQVTEHLLCIMHCSKYLIDIAFRLSILWFKTILSQFKNHF